MGRGARPRRADDQAKRPFTVATSEFGWIIYVSSLSMEQLCFFSLKKLHCQLESIYRTVLEENYTYLSTGLRPDSSVVECLMQHKYLSIWPISRPKIKPRPPSGITLMTFC